MPAVGELALAQLRREVTRVVDVLYDCVAAAATAAMRGERGARQVKHRCQQEVVVAGRPFAHRARHIQQRSTLDSF